MLHDPPSLVRDKEDSEGRTVSCMEHAFLPVSCNFAIPNGVRIYYIFNHEYEREIF